MKKETPPSLRIMDYGYFINTYSSRRLKPLCELASD